VFNRLHKKDALVVAEAVLEKLFPGTLEAHGGESFEVVAK